MKLIVSQEIENNNINAHNTIDTSQIKNSNKSIKSNKIFKKEKTEVLIIDNEENNAPNIIQILSKNKDNKTKDIIKKFKKDLVLRINKKKIFENQLEINDKKYLNKSFSKNNANSNILENNSIRKITEVNQKNDESKKKEKEKNKLKYIIINK